MKVFRQVHPHDTRRRLGVIGRLEAQLKSGKKIFGNYISGGTTDLTEDDKTRINKELTTLRSRIQTY